MVGLNNGNQQTVDGSRKRRTVFTPSTLNVYILFPFWFVCFWAFIGTAWRPPLVSVGLFVFFLAIIAAIEWLPRRFVSKNIPYSISSRNVITEMLDESVQQQIIRTKTAEGLDRLDGTFLAEFPIGATTTTIHIPFCPAFGRIPKVHAFSIDEADASFRIASPKTFGLRIDVKRNHWTVDRCRFAIVAEG